MDITNPSALVLLTVRALTALAVLVWVIPITIRELRRKQFSKPLYALRWGLFVLSILYVLPAIFPIWSGITRVDEPPASQLTVIASYWQSVREVSIGIMIIVIYSLSNLLNRSR